MTDNDNGKKMIEEAELLQFLDAYREVTGMELSVIGSTENPDFICERRDGKRIGVELTKANGDLDTVRWEILLQGAPAFDPFYVLDCLYSAVETKAAKLMASRFSGETILVLQSDYHPLDDLEDFLTPDLAGDFADFGFTEIWIADFTTLEEFGSVDLFCLKPLQLWGHYNLQSGKPYG